MPITDDARIRMSAVPTSEGAWDDLKVQVRGSADRRGTVGTGGGVFNVTALLGHRTASTAPGCFPDARPIWARSSITAWDRLADRVAKAADLVLAG